MIVNIERTNFYNLISVDKKIIFLLKKLTEMILLLLNVNMSSMNWFNFSIYLWKLPNLG